MKIGTPRTHRLSLPMADALALNRRTISSAAARSSRCTHRSFKESPYGAIFTNPSADPLTNSLARPMTSQPSPCSLASATSRGGRANLPPRQPTPTKSGSRDKTKTTSALSFRSELRSRPKFCCGTALTPCPSNLNAAVQDLLQHSKRLIHVVDTPITLGHFPHRPDRFVFGSNQSLQSRIKRFANHRPDILHLDAQFIVRRALLLFGVLSLQVRVKPSVIGRLPTATACPMRILLLKHRQFLLSVIKPRIHQLQVRGNVRHAPCNFVVHALDRFFRHILQRYFFRHKSFLFCSIPFTVAVRDTDSHRPAPRRFAQSQNAPAK